MYKKRIDGRKFDELRKIEAKAGVIKRAKGSGMFRIGNTHAVAAVYGPTYFPSRKINDPKECILRCHYNMISFSGKGERVRPGPSRRSKEISFVTESALIPVIDLSDFPISAIDVYIELLQTDAGTRCAGICAASIALADAGIPMKDLVSAIAVGIVDGKLVLDINSHEDCNVEGLADMAMAMASQSGEITLLQLDGKASKENVKKAIELGKKACKEIYEIQKKALLEKYKK